MGRWSRVRSKLSAMGQKLTAMADFPWAQEWPEITDERVRAAFAKVPRAEFVPEAYRDWSDRDVPLPIGEDQTISQPFVVALMVQVLNLQPGMRVLEIGTGSGFQTAILCELTAQTGQASGQNVYSVERFGSLANQAEVILHRLGYQPHLAVGDGAMGWPDQAPFDAIIVSAAPAHLPLPLWTQLAEQGSLVAPIGVHAQMLWRLTKVQGKVVKKELGPVRFVPLISPLLNDPDQRMAIGDRE